MPIKFRCNVCGSNECYKIDTFSDDRKRYGEVAGRFTNKRGIFSYNYSTTNGKVGLKMEISSAIDSYVCKNCGHVEFYANQLINKINNDEQFYKDKVKVLEAQLKVAQENIEKFRKEYSDTLDERSKIKYKNDMDSTERVQYESKKSDYSDRLKAILVEIEYEKFKVKETEMLIKEYKFFLENVFNVVFR